MLLALRSGIEEEVSWALERLCRLSCNEQFTLASIPGLTDALFEWPEWYLSACEQGSKASEENAGDSGYGDDTVSALLFAPPPVDARKRRRALEALFVLRNAAVGPANSAELSAYSRTRPFIARALAISQTTDERTQFVLYTLDLLQCLASSWVLPPAGKDADKANTDPVPALEQLTRESNNRSIILGALSALTVLYGTPANAAHSSSESPALATCVRCLPLFQDSALVDTCVNFLYAHLSHPPLTRAFLLHRAMPQVLRLLVGYILSQQVEETKTVDITQSVRTVPAVKVKSVAYELTSDELTRIGNLSEPERCSQWYELRFFLLLLIMILMEGFRLRTALAADPNEELTQVEFWNMYKDLFTPYSERTPLLQASDVIKHASVIYPTAVAMVLTGPPQKFIIRGITRRKKLVPADDKVCQWDRGQCLAIPFQTHEELVEHVKSHLDAQAAIGGEAAHGCMWATCQRTAPSAAILAPHVWTHLPLKGVTPNPSSLPEITLATAEEAYPIPDATQRPIPPPPRTIVTAREPTADPPSGALGALLVLRTLFRAAFASGDEAPRADADHFGFPGAQDEPEMEETQREQGAGETEAEREGARRGRRGFVGVRDLMGSVRIRDPALMSWIDEMLDATLTGTL